MSKKINYKGMKRYVLLTYKNKRHIQTFRCKTIKIRKPYIHILESYIHAVIYFV